VTRTSRLGITNIALVNTVKQKQTAKKRQQNVVKLANRAPFQLLVFIVAVETE
jgi:hypothetical protein